MVAGVWGVESWAAPLPLLLSLGFCRNVIVKILSYLRVAKNLAPPGLHHPRGAFVLGVRQHHGAVA